MARKSKVFCPECGAKNGAEIRRCRVCSNLLNVDAPEEKRKVKEIRLPSVEKKFEETLDRPFDASELKAAVGGSADAADDDDAPAIPFAVPTGPPLPVDGLGPPPLDATPDVPVEGIEIDAVARHAPPPPPPPPTALPDDEPFVGIEMDVAPRHGAPPPPPPPPPSAEEESFDSFAGIELDVAPRHGAPPPPPPPPPSAEEFRLDELEIEPPS